MFKVGDKVTCVNPAPPRLPPGTYYVRRLCTSDTGMMEVSTTPTGPLAARGGILDDTKHAWNKTRFRLYKPRRDRRLLL